MAETTEISWCDHTFNPWIGCTKVSRGCRFCYAETLMDHRYGRAKWGPSGTRVRTSAAYWNAPLAWNRRAAAEGRRARVFCASLADVFEDRDELRPWRRDLFVLVEKTPHLDWLLLTKRPENVRRFRPAAWGSYPGGVVGQTRWPANAWVGTSVEDQTAADERIPELQKVPAAVRFLSCEPLLGPVDLGLSYPCPACDGKGGGRSFNSSSLDDGAWDCDRCDGTGVVPFRDIPDWVIVGGESGPGARPMHPDWARSLRDQCRSAGIPFHFKQHGEWIDGRDWPAYRAGEFKGQTLEIGQDADRNRCHIITLCRVGKKAAGRRLDGEVWDQFPAPEKAVTA